MENTATMAALDDYRYLRTYANQKLSTDHLRLWLVEICSWESWHRSVLEQQLKNIIFHEDVLFQNLEHSQVETKNMKCSSWHEWPQQCMYTEEWFLRPWDIFCTSTRLIFFKDLSVAKGNHLTEVISDIDRLEHPTKTCFVHHHFLFVPCCLRNKEKTCLLTIPRLSCVTLSLIQTG